MKNRRILTALTIALLIMPLILAGVPLPARAQIPPPTLSPTSGKVGDEVTVTVTDVTVGGLVRIYWDSVKDWDGQAGLIAEGYAVGPDATIKFKVPEATAGPHYVIAKDVESGLSNYTMFTVQPKIVLSPVKGLPGDLITVTGTGYAGESAVYIYLNVTEVIGESVSLTGYQNGTTITNATGTLERTPVAWHDPLTTITLTVDVYNDTTSTTVVFDVSDDGAGNLFGEAEATTLAVLINASGTIDYATGFFNLTLMNNQTWSMELYPTAIASYSYYLYDVTPAAGVTTSGLGSFTVEVEVPSISVDDFGPYKVLAVDALRHDASYILMVDYYILVDPTSGPPGITVTVSGRISAEADAEVKFGAGNFWVTAFTTTSDENGYFEGTYTIPSTLEAGTFNFNVSWLIDTEPHTKSTSFTVTTPPTITLDPTSARAGEEVKVTGDNFVPNAGITVYFNTIVVNNTVTTDDNGHFVATFTVPSVAAGTYTVKAVDEYGASAEEFFTVKPPLVIVIKTSATSYLQGDTVSIFVNVSEPQLDVSFAVTDPTGLVWWRVEGVDINVEFNGGYTTAARYSFTLPSDAPIGTWNFTAYDSGGGILATNLFTVSSKAILPGFEELSARVSALEESVAALSEALDELSGKVELLSGAVEALTPLSEAVSTLREEVRGLGEDLTSVMQDLTTLKQDVSSASSAASDAKSAAENAASAAQAAQAAAQGLMTAVYGAIILSLIAALASIIAVITLQRKIAG